LFDDTPDDDLFTANNDQLGTDSCFHGLAIWGGPTETMRPKRCNMQSPIASLDEGGTEDEGLQYDQRGASYARKINGTLDVGAFECQTSQCPGAASIPGPGEDFAPDSSGFTNDSDVAINRDTARPVPGEILMEPAYESDQYTIRRVPPLRLDAIALWDDPLLVLGE
jgi:hypothetical protein